MKMAGFYDESISNGIGWRAVLFVSGCPHNCPGCHNKEAQNFNYGKEFNSKEIIEKIKDNSILKGITISGGEPLCKENIKEVLQFIKDVDKVVEGFAHPDNLLYAPEIKFYSNEVVLDKNFMTNIKGLYSIGDGGGLTTGLMMASCAGVKMARIISDKN